MKFITSTDLAQWADTKDCQTTLPELIRKLINSSTRTIKRLTIPSGDAVNLSGWDGIVETTESINTIEKGISLWEMGTNKEIKKKIDDDFNKRNGNPLGFEMAEATFVFITPRKWAGATKWIEDKKKNSKWKDIVVYTAIELEYWIEQHPTVGLWLATLLNKVPLTNGMELPSTFWDKWAKGRDVMLRYDLLLGGRTEAINSIKEITETPTAIYIEALAKEEALAFIVATLMFIGEESPAIADKCLMVESEEVLQQLSMRFDNIIFIMPTMVSIPQTVIDKGHSVACAVSPADEVSNSKLVKLPIIERDAFITSLKASGIDGSKARQLALDTARNVMALRRRQEIDVKPPKWAAPRILQPLIPAILVGKWNGSVTGDKNILEKMSNATYNIVEQRLKESIFIDDSPFIEVDGIWRTTSPYEAIRYVMPLLTNENIHLLGDVFKEVMADDDPEAIEKMECTDLRFWTHKQIISKDLKKGLCQALILLTIHDEKWQSYVDNIVEEVLKGFSLQRYLSNRHIFMSLAEVSPKCVLDFIERDINDGCVILKELFVIRESSIGWMGTNIYYAELLWALEEIAWDESYLLRCVLILGKLCEFPNDSNYGNKPINSLEHILHFILPQTYAGEKERDSVLCTLSKKNPKVGSILILKLLQDLSVGGVCELTVHYSWRLYDRRNDPKHITPVHPDRVRNAGQIMLGVIELTTDNVNKLIKLSLHHNMRCIRGMILEYVDSHKHILKGNEDVCKTIRDELSHQMAYEEEYWASEETGLKPYQDLLHELEPDSILKKNKWLFENSHIAVRCKKTLSHEEMYEMQEGYRRAAIKEIITWGGLSAIIAFAKLIKYPQALGKNYATETEGHTVDEIIRNYVESKLPDEFITGYFHFLYNQKGYEWLIDKASTIKPIEKSLVLLCAPMYNKGIAIYVETLPLDMQKKYWSTVEVWNYPPNESLYIIDKMFSTNRVNIALQAIYRTKKDKVPIGDLQKLEFLSRTMNAEVQLGEMDMFYLIKIIEDLDKSEEPKVIEELPRWEFLLYQALEHQMDVNSLKLIQVILHQPSSLMELIEMASFSEDENERDEQILRLQQDKNKSLSMGMASYLLRNLYGTPCSDENGVVNTDSLNVYIDELIGLSEKNKRRNRTYSMIGHLLGNIPEKDNYPPEYLSDIIERLDNNEVDNSYEAHLFNKQGVTFRSHNAGGQIERERAKQFKSYSERTKYSHPRITRIFDRLIVQYEEMARQEDTKARLTDLDN
jgi:hypothetical protein